MPKFYFFTFKELASGSLRSLATYHLNFKFFIILACLLFIGHKDYNNRLGAYIAVATQNSSYKIIMACLQALVNRRLLTTCLCGKAAVKANYVVCPATYQCSVNWSSW